MRILTLSSSYPKYEGDTTAPFIAEITRALVARGHTVTMVLPDRRDLDPVPIEGVRFRPYRYAPVGALEVFGYAESLRADVALRWASYLAAPFAVLSGIRKLFAEARADAFDAVHAHWVVPGGAMAWPVSKARDLPLVVSLHGSDVFLAEKKRVFREAARRAFSQAAAVTACSDDLAARSLGLGASETPRVIPYGVDAEAFSGTPGKLPRELPLEPVSEEPLLLAVGRLVEKKGFEYLIDAAAMLREKGRAVRVVLAGKGDLAAALGRRAEERGIRARVHLVGDVGRESLPSLYAAADVIAVPSVRDAAGNVDGLPNVLLEAMASGRPIVATDVAGIPGALRRDRDGLLVPERDAAALAAAIEKILDAPELGRALGASARRRVQEEFSWDLAGERFESVLRAVAEARRRAS